MHEDPLVSSSSGSPFPARARVAIVDDDPAFGNAINRLLQTAGLSSEIHESVGAFVRTGAVHRVHCVILDIFMPEIDGLSLQACLRDTNYALPIIFCSGSSDEEARAQAMRDGAVCVLQKPVHAEDLFRALHEALPNGVLAGVR